MERALDDLAGMAMGRARRHVLDELEAAAVEAYEAAHRLGERAKAEPQHAAVYVGEVAELTARGVVYDSLAAHVRRLEAAAAQAPAALEAVMAGCAVLAEPSADDVAAALERVKVA